MQNLLYFIEKEKSLHSTQSNIAELLRIHMEEHLESIHCYPTVH